MNSEKDHGWLGQQEEIPQLPWELYPAKAVCPKAHFWIPGLQSAASICLRTRNPFRVGLLKLWGPRRKKKWCYFLAAFIYLNNQIIDHSDHLNIPHLRGHVLLSLELSAVPEVWAGGQRGGRTTGKELTGLDAEAHEGVQRVRSYALDIRTHADEPLH